MAPAVLPEAATTATRMGRWSAAHWKTATFGWLALMVVAFAVGGMVGTKNVDPNTAGPGQSGRMDRILAAGCQQPAGESILIRSCSVRAGTPAFDAAVEDVDARVSKLADVENVRSPLAPGNAGQVSRDGHAALVEFDIRGDKDTAVDRIDPVLAAVETLNTPIRASSSGEFGDASAVKAVDTAFANDLASAGVFSIPITLIILVVASCGPGSLSFGTEDTATRLRPARGHLHPAAEVSAAARHHGPAGLHLGAEAEVGRPADRTPLVGRCGQREFGSSGQAGQGRCGCAA